MLLKDEKNKELENLEEAVVVPKKKRKSKAKSKVEEPKVEEPKEDIVVNEEKEEDEFSKLMELIPQWKQEYKRVFKNEFDGEIIIWRRLKRKEYKDILKQLVDEDDRLLSRQEKMVEAAVLFPFNIKELLDENAGLATVLSEEILSKSGFALSYTEEL